MSANDTSKFELSKKLGAGLTALTALLVLVTNGITGTVVSGVSSGTADEMTGLVQQMIDQDKEIEAMITPEEHRQKLEIEIERRNRDTFVDTTIEQYGQDIGEIKTQLATNTANQADMQVMQEYMTDKIEDIAAAIPGANP